MSDMSERSKLETHIQQYIKENAVDNVQAHSCDTARVVMEALDSWIEEQQPEQAGFKIGDRVKMVAPNTDEDNGPTLPAKGFIAAYHDSIEAHYLVIFDEEFDEGHDGFGSATDESGNSISVNNGWYCDEQVLEKV